MEDLKEELKEEYVLRCAKICQEGYSKLSFSKEEIRTELMEKYRNNGNEKEVSGLIIKIERAVFDFLDIKMSRGQRSFGWPHYHEETLMKEINTALQQA